MPLLLLLLLVLVPPLAGAGEGAAPRLRALAWLRRRLRLLPELLERAPREFLLWGRQGSGATFEGDPTQYTNSAYVMSADVVDAVAADVQASTCHNSPGEDFCMGRSATAGFGAVLRNDERWFNDDTGDPSLCLCKPWTLEDGDALLVHHVRPQLLEAFARNKTRFAEMRYPDRSYL